MIGTEYIICDTDADTIKIQGKSIKGETLINLTACNEINWFEFTKDQAIELIEAIQNAIKEVD